MNASVLAGWLYWTGYQLVSLVLTIIGWPLLAVAAGLRLWRKGVTEAPWNYGARAAFHWTAYPFLYLYDNDEDGITGSSAEPTFLTVWKWSAWRNPVNNLRFALPGCFWIVDCPVNVAPHSFGFVVTAGWRQCLYIIIGSATYRIGWSLSTVARPGYRVWPILERYS